MKSDEKRYIGYLERFHKRIRSDQFYGKVLDAGCGDGYDAFIISKYARKVVGVDIKKNADWKRHEKTNLSFRSADAQNLPYRSATFDGIFCKDVLHHAENPQKVLRELRRVAKRRSRIVIVEANRYNPIFYMHMTKMLGHEHFRKEVFMNLIKKEFPRVTFLTLESHFFPIRDVPLFKLASTIVELIFALPLIKEFQSYIVAYISK